MPNSLQSSAIASPASRRATNCSLSSITEHSFQGIIPSPLRGESVTYVSGTMCYLCLRPLTKELALVSAKPSRTQKGTFSCPFLCPFSLVLCSPFDSLTLQLRLMTMVVALHALRTETATPRRLPELHVWLALW